MRVPLVVWLIASGCDATQEEPLPAPRSPAASASAVRVPSTRRLELADVRVEAPLEFVDLEPDRVERLRQANIRRDPTANVKVVGLRAPTSMLGGTVYVQSGDGQRSISAKDLSVKEALELESELVKAELAARARILHYAVTPEDGALEACAQVQMDQGGNLALMRLCSSFSVRVDGRLAIQAVGCIGNAGSDALCDAAMKSRSFTLDPSRRRFDEVLTANAKPLGFVDGRDVAGVVFGASVADFRAACKKAGHAVDDFDWAAEVDAVRGWVKGGLMSKCSGLPQMSASGRAFDLGKVVDVNVQAADGKVASATFFLDAPFDVVEARVSEAYPDGLVEMGMNVHVIEAAPSEPDDLVSATVAHSRARGARSSVTFLSKRYMNAPPLPGMQPLPARGAPK